MEQTIFATIHNLRKEVTFSHKEASSLTPLLNKLSAKTAQQLKFLNQKLSASSNKIEIQEEINHCLQKWSDNVRRLGVVPISLHRVAIRLTDGNHARWEFSNPAKTKIN